MGINLDKGYYKSRRINFAVSMDNTNHQENNCNCFHIHEI